MKGFFRASWFGPTFFNQKVIERWPKNRLTGDKVLETKAVCDVNCRKSWLAVAIVMIQKLH
jgi:hypothetical protein